MPAAGHRAWSGREVSLAAGAGALFLVMLAVLWLWRRQPDAAPLRVDQLTRSSSISTGPPNMENLLTLATDGDRILTSVMHDGRPQLSSISISTGEIQRLALPQELAANSLADISKDGSKLLLRSHLSSASEQPLWVVPSSGGRALRVGDVLAHDASWMPDGTGVLYANGSDLAIIRLGDGVSTPFAKLNGRAFWMRWSPDGKLLRFTLMDPLTHSSGLWELDRSGGAPRRVSTPNGDHLSACCGTWTADGSAYVLQAGDDLWALKGSGQIRLRASSRMALCASSLQWQRGRDLVFSFWGWTSLQVCRSLRGARDSARCPPFYRMRRVWIFRTTACGSPGRTAATILCGAHGRSMVQTRCN